MTSAVVRLSLVDLEIPSVKNPRGTLGNKPRAIRLLSWYHRVRVCVGVSGLALAMLAFEDRVVSASLQQCLENCWGRLQAKVEANIRKGPGIGCPHS